MKLVSDEMDRPGKTPLAAIARFPIGDRVVQLAASDFRCVARIVNDGLPAPLGCTLERVPRDRFPEALLPGDEVLAAYAAGQIIPPAVVLVRDSRGHPVFVTREPNGTWTQHELSTFQAPSDCVSRKIFLGIGGGIVVLGGVLADISLTPVYLLEAMAMGNHQGSTEEREWARR